MNPGILSGLRVIDLAHGIPGPMAAMQLGEAGAEVIKVEPPGGDPARGTAQFSVLNRGKLSVTLDLAADHEALHRLLAASDVLIHDLTPSAAAKVGLDDARLAAAHPHLVVSAITGWPARHPLAEAPARETLVLARLGLLDEQPGHRDGPIFIRMPFASWMAGWLCATGVVARLIARRRDGRGGAAHTSLAQGALGPMTMHWARTQTPSPVFAKGLDKSTPVPLHRCADGRWIHVHYSPDAAPWMAEALEALGPEEVARLNSLHLPSHVAPNFGANKAIIATRAAQDWVEHFWTHDVAAQIAAPFGEIYFNEQARANGYVVEVEDPVFGPTLQPGPVVTIDPPAQVRGPLHALGADAAQAFPAAINAPPAAGKASGRAPLDGMKVLDLGAYLAGPFAAMLLADLGAEVIKVEPPAGDAMRRLERIFAGTQRGKRGLALKLGDPASRPVVDALARWADVVHLNIRRPAARKLGVDYDTLHALNPALVYCHVSSYGPKGPRADWPGFDQLFQASCGWEVANAGEGNPPMWLRFGITDHLAAVSSLFALLLAVYRRDGAGEGQLVASSLLGAALLTVSEVVGRPEGGSTVFAVLDAEQTGLSPEHRLYRCRDGWIAVAALDPAEASAFRTLTGAAPAQFFADRPLAEAAALLAKAGVPAEPVRLAQMDAFLGDPATVKAGLRATYRHARYGQMEQIGGLWDFGDLPLRLDRPPPTLGEHSREILDELGLGGEFDALQGAGLVVG